MLVSCFYPTAAKRNPWLPLSATGNGGEVSFGEVAEVGEDVLALAESSALSHSLAARSSRILRSPFEKNRSNRLVYGHDALVRQSLWEEHGVRPAVDVVDYRKLRRRSRGNWGTIAIDWVSRVEEDVSRLRGEVIKRYGKLYHHSDLLHLYNTEFLETVALRAASRGRRAKLPFVSLREALGVPFSEKQQKELEIARSGAAAVGEAALYVFQNQKIKVDNEWMTRAEWYRRKADGSFFDWEKLREGGEVQEVGELA